MKYKASTTRYNDMKYRRCGNSGVVLPEISLGLWHNFGDITPFSTQKEILRTAFDNGILHFDLANNYGPPCGEAERNFGKHLKNDFLPYRDELIISTKAGFLMWDGPYGNYGSRKYLIASLDQSLKRMGLDYVDIFYHHCPDPNTPLEETMSALDQIVRSGKALYVGLSNYKPTEARKAMEILKSLGTPCLINQPSYAILNRWIEEGLTNLLYEEKVGCICYAPLRSGILTGKYLNGIPKDSRIAKDPRYLKNNALSESVLKKVSALDKLAKQRGETLSQMALAWVLNNKVVTSALIGASKPSQVLENIKAVHSSPFTQQELDLIDSISKGE